MIRLKSMSRRGNWPLPRLRRLLPLALLIALPACATGGSADQAGVPPADGALVGSSLPMGKSVSGNYLAARFAQSQHDLGTAANYLIRSLAKDPDNVELLQRAYLSLAADGRMVEAAAMARRLLAYDGEASIAAILIAEQQAKGGDWAEAERTMSSLPRRGLTSFMAPLIMAWARMGEGNPNAALEALVPLVQTSNFAALYEFHAALVNDLADRRAEADQHYQSTLAGNGGLTLRTAEAAADFYERIGQHAKAQETLARYRQQHHDSVLAAFQPGTTRLIGSPAAGLAEAMFGAAGSLRQSNVPELALIFARMAIDLQPNFPLAQVLVADILETLGRRDDANKVLTAIDPASSVYWSAQLRVAGNLDDAGDAPGAVRTLEALSAKYPNRPEALVTLGDVERRHKHWPEAISAYDRALAIFGPQAHGTWAVYYSRGIALERNKQWPLAETDFLKALELQPNEPHVLNYLGYSWIEQGVNLDQARAMIEKAVEQRPTDGFIVDSLGWAHYRTGNYVKAVETLERAVELHPEDATINDHLGDALWNVGRVDEARFQWQRALVFNPDPELKVEIERKLKVGLQTPPPAVEKNAAVMR